MEDSKTLPADRSGERKPYQPPLLIQYGSIQDLTRQRSGGSEFDDSYPDDGSNSARWGE